MFPPPLSAMVVGSTPQPGWLVDRSEGSLALQFRFTGDRFDEAVRDAIRTSALDQQAAGLDVIGDGEQDRLSYRDHFVRRMRGVEYPQSEDQAGFEVRPRAVAPLSLPAPVAAANVALLRSITTRPIKLTVIGPFTLARRMDDAYYGDADRFGRAIADVINGELRALEAAGCDVLQIDEPHFTAVEHPPGRIAWGIDLVNRSLDGISAPVVMHMCFGYAAAVREKNDAKATTAYHAVLPHLRGARPDILSLELEQPKADLGLLALCPDTRFLLGLLDLGIESIETPSHIASRIYEAAKVVGRDRLLCGPDCGMKFVPRGIANEKLRALVAGAALARGS